MRRGKIISAVVAMTATIIGAGAPDAGAFSNAPAGSQVQATLTSSTVRLGSLMSCTRSTFAGAVADDAGPEAGGALDFSQVTFGGCTSNIFGPNLVWTANTTPPWRWTINGAGTTTGPADITVSWGVSTARLVGMLAGAYSQSTGQLVLSGSLTRVSGASLMPSVLAFQGTYNMRNSANLPVQL